MLSPYQYAVWFICTALELGVVVCAIQKQALRRYIFLNIAMLVSATVSIARYQIFKQYGLASEEYSYFYFYSDFLLIITLYFAITSLYSHVFAELNAERYVRIGTILLLCLTALFSYAIVQQSSAKLTGPRPFVVELSQNLYFVGLVLTYVLWGAVLKLRESRTRLIQLILSLGVYFSMFAAKNALQNLYHGHSSIFHYLGPLLGCFLPLSWMYSFWRIPEEARIVPARLAVAQR